MTTDRKRHPRGSIKRLTLQLLEQSAGDGLDVATAVQQAAAQGVTVTRATMAGQFLRLLECGVADRSPGRYAHKYWLVS